MCACTLALAAAAPRPARAASFFWQASLVSRFEYFETEDLFGGRFAPFYQMVELSLGRRGRATLEGYFYAARDLASGDDLHLDFFSLYLDLAKLGRVTRARIGRFPLDGGPGYEVIDGLEVRLELARRAGMDLYLGRKKVFYDTRYVDTVGDRAPYTDTGLAGGLRFLFEPAAGSELSLGWSRFDPETGGSKPEDHLHYQLAWRDEPGLLRVDLVGARDLTAQAGSVMRLRARRLLDSGVELAGVFESLRPDRVSPEVIPRVFLAHRLRSAGALVSWPLGERLEAHGGFERLWFRVPGGDGDGSSSLLRLGVQVNQWTSRGLVMDLGTRWLGGEPGSLLELSLSGEKRLTRNLLAGWSLAYVSYRREGAERESASAASGRLRVALPRDLWLEWELENLRNLDFDYNLRTRLTLRWVAGSESARGE